MLIGQTARVRAYDAEYRGSLNWARNINIAGCTNSNPPFVQGLFFTGAVNSANLTISDRPSKPYVLKTF